MELVQSHRPRRLVFLDETWFTTNMTRLFGYAPSGKRLFDWQPQGHWKTTTFLAGLSIDGFIAPLVQDGPMNSESFVAYLDQVLCKEIRKGDLVILDNLSSHKTAAARAAFVRHAIAYEFLPPYSPDLNPIENAFSKLKRLVRTAAERTVDGLWRAIGTLIDQFSRQECRNYLRHSGYPLR